MDEEVKSASPSDPPHVEQKQTTGEDSIPAVCLILMKHCSYIVNMFVD